jgi:hypothetical protein
VRFCPFCSAENADELAVCESCGRRLPPLPPRRAARPNAAQSGVNLPPRPPPPQRPRNASPPPPLPVPGNDDSRRGLANALSPGPAAQRRDAPPAEVREPGQEVRRHHDYTGIPLGARTASSQALKPQAQVQPVAVERTHPNTAPPSHGPEAEPHARGNSDGRPKPSSIPPPLDRSGPLRAADRSRPLPARSGFEDDFHTVPSATPYDGAAAPRPSPTLPPPSRNPVPAPAGREPPPTHIQRPEALADRPFAPPKVLPIPEIPEPGLINAARYAVRFGQARWQRRGAIRTLGLEIKQDTEALDQVLGALGRVARSAGVDSRVFSAENNAINDAEARMEALSKESGDVDARKADENSRFVDVERERNMKLVEAERMVDEAQKELAHLEAQRRGARDKRKEIERRQRAYLKAAEDNDRQSASTQLGESRQELRRSAEQHRKEAAALEPERQEIDRRLSALERPINEATARVDAAKAELDAAKRSLSDAREGHTHRLDELDAEQKRKSREIALAEAEIARRLVTLGTLVNLNRIEDPQFDELYQRIDRLRGAITSRTTEIEKLAAEREAYDRGSIVRGISVIGGAFVALIALIVILRAII